MGDTKRNFTRLLLIIFNIGRWHHTNWKSEKAIFVMTVMVGGDTMHGPGTQLSALLGKTKDKV